MSEKVAGAADSDPSVLWKLKASDPAKADAVHAPVTGVFPEVRRWVVDCGLSFVQSSIHRGGILDPASGDFHGRLLREKKYAFGVCQDCHGADFAGGSSGVATRVPSASGTRKRGACAPLMNSRCTHDDW